MRTIAKILILASAAVGAATFGVADPARASTVQCAQQPLRAETPTILVVTCIEAEGDQRRSQSTVINGADESITLMELRALISFPQYGLTDCGASRLEPGAQAVCISPWVTTRTTWSATHAAAYSLVRVIEAQGRYTFLAGRIHTHFEPTGGAAVTA
ncbi:MAG TPA: hypothetical protein VK453_00555 [Micromonosporaceae bacterium]|nr:hypothetical protein [Micromonosporaceae bacterium]